MKRITILKVVSTIFLGSVIELGILICLLTYPDYEVTNLYKTLFISSPVQIIIFAILFHKLEDFPYIKYRIHKRTKKDKNSESVTYCPEYSNPLIMFWFEVNNWYSFKKNKNVVYFHTIDECRDFIELEKSKQNIDEIILL